jgi:hypothetical protein
MIWSGVQRRQPKYRASRNRQRGNYVVHDCYLGGRFYFTSGEAITGRGPSFSACYPAARLFGGFFALCVGRIKCHQRQVARSGKSARSTNSSLSFQTAGIAMVTSNLRGRRPISLRFCVSRRQASPRAGSDGWPNRGRSRHSWLVDVFGTTQEDA